MAEILRYEHVDISYNGVKVVKDVSFTVDEGEILGIVGESGSGKSTLIKAAMGLLGPAGLVTRGDIWYREKNLPDLSASEMRKLNGPELGMIFQMVGSSFCPIRTVGAQLYESMTEHEKISRDAFQARAVELLQKIGFENTQRILDSYPFELSGGMQQRVGIAAAMLLNPGILLADEPTSALDVSVQKQVVEEMLLVRKTFGTSIVLVTHNIGVIGAMADKVLVMKNDEMVEYGETRQILDAPKEAYTRTLMSAVPRLPTICLVVVIVVLDKIWCVLRQGIDHTAAERVFSGFHVGAGLRRDAFCSLVSFFLSYCAEGFSSPLVKQSPLAFMLFTYLARYLAKWNAALTTRAVIDRNRNTRKHRNKEAQKV